MSRIEKLQSLLAAEPDDAFLNYSLALELAKTDRAEESLARFDRVLEIDRTYLAAFHHKGRTLLALGRFDEARSVLEAGVARAGECGNEHARSEMQDLLASF